MFIGVLNVLEGSDGEIDIKREFIVEETSGKASVAQPEWAAAETQAEADIHDDAATSMLEETESDKADDADSAENISGVVTVSYETLKGISNTSDLPKGVDPLNREQALSDDEFVNVFGIDKASFQSLPGWKRTKFKKDHGLF